MLGRSGGPHERGSERTLRRHDELDRNAVGGDTRVGVEQCHDLGQRREALAHRARVIEGTTTARCVETSSQRRASPAAIPPSAAAIASVSARARGSSRPRVRGRRSCSSAARIFAAVFSPIPGTSRSRPWRAAAPELRHRRDPEVRPDLDRALRPDADEPAECRELERRRLPELGELCDVARLDQLAQPGLDPWPDAPQRADSPLVYERGDLDGSGTDDLCRPPVGACAVVAGTGELEQRRELLQARRDAKVGDLSLQRRTPAALSP